MWGGIIHQAVRGLGLNQTSAERLALRVFAGEEFEIGDGLRLLLNQTSAERLALSVLVRR